MTEMADNLARVEEAWEDCVEQDAVLEAITRRLLPGPRHPSAPFWEQPGGLALDRAAFDRTHEVFVVRFALGGTYRLPLSNLPGSKAVLFADVDDLRHGVVVLFEDGSTTSFASDYVLYELEPQYRAVMQPAPRVRAPADFGRRIRDLREAAGRTARGVAEAAGMAPPNYSRLERSRHRPTVTTLVRVAGALGVPLADLLSVAADRADVGRRRGTGGSPANGGRRRGT